MGKKRAAIPPAGAIVPVERIRQAIATRRGHRVMLDEALAELYQVETRLLVRNVKRNLSRFPADFMFQLTDEEWTDLRSQNGISNERGGRRYRPYAFTEQGVAMLSSVLRSERAVLVNVEIMRAFVRLRELLASNEALARRLAVIEKSTDVRFTAVFKAIRMLMEREERPARQRRRIGFASQPDE